MIKDNENGEKGCHRAAGGTGTRRNPDGEQEIFGDFGVSIPGRS